MHRYSPRVEDVSWFWKPPIAFLILSPAAPSKRAPESYLKRVPHTKQKRPLLNQCAPCSISVAYSSKFVNWVDASAVFVASNTMLVIVNFPYTAHM